MMMISRNRCVGCGMCASVCPADAVYVDTEKGFAVFKEDKCINCHVCIENCTQNAIKDVKEELVFAIGTDDGKTIKNDDHFGMSKIFQIWKYTDGELIFQEERVNVKYEEDETRIHGDPNKAKATSSVLGSVDVLVGKMMGPNIVRLQKKFVPIIVRESAIDETLEILKENLIEIIEEKEEKERRGLILK
jgi:ferredoxin